MAILHAFTVLMLIRQRIVFSTHANALPVIKLFHLIWGCATGFFCRDVYTLPLINVFPNRLPNNDRRYDYLPRWLIALGCTKSIHLTGGRT
jgi:hypothetical protein